MTFLAALWRFFPPRTGAFIAIAVMAVALALGLYFAGRGDERDAADRRQHKAETRASAGRETAAEEDVRDTSNIQTRQQERDHDAEALPDGAPDDRERRRRCRQLRDHGIDVAACRGSAG